ncbi:MFS transporter [Pectobacterium sp. FL60-S17]|uniref:MFS transporter n=1 Tax=Pectobacterium quasiaquaticum TaxID=2774015 RepID=A0A9Q2IAP5_9GAMM|nr:MULTISPECIES: MFS transporter [Pectobacterium]MBE5203982.1 MFS transporter [Pectobacterium quasiaquaticum]MBE5212057.1 MFS transporter [Pectobacterium quasiaquaticum]MBE5214956.1 MFS transporter [Pectobacterium quasiaquaticum]MBE5221730.1 MFS transporter [Pectobacterium quasiaquaticum]MBE5224385.1 MFS transporter [Pectobacterium quasiaquaticum]
MTAHSREANFTTLNMIIAASLVGLVTGYTLPLISLKLAELGHSTATLGILAALPAAGMMLSSFVTPWLSRHLHASYLLSGSLIVLAASTVASFLLSHPVSLILPRLLTGLASGVLVVLGETWVTSRASDKHKATLTGLYASVFTGCQLIGPLLIAAGEHIQIYALWLICGISAACAFMLRNCASMVRADEQSSTSYRDLIPFLPAIASGVLCFSFFDASILALFPLYGMEQGLDEKSAILLVTLIFLGDAIFQTPIGWLADKCGIIKTHIGCGILFCVMLVSITFSFSSPSLLIPVCIVLGAAAGGLYTLSLVRAGQKFAGQRLIVMNSLLGLVWSAGSISGPLFSGAAITFYGYDGLIAILLLTGVLFVGIQGVLRKARVSRSLGEE